MIEAPRKVERLLEKSGRITPREVLEAYGGIGFTPCSHDWYTNESMCALSAVTLHNGIHPSRVVDYTAQRVGGSINYVVSFTEGFSGLDLSLNGHALGYLDGRRARRFVESRHGRFS